MAPRARSDPCTSTASGISVARSAEDSLTTVKDPPATTTRSPSDRRVTWALPSRTSARVCSSVTDRRARPATTISLSGVTTRTADKALVTVTVPRCNSNRSAALSPIAGRRGDSTAVTWASRSSSATEPAARITVMRACGTSSSMPVPLSMLSPARAGVTSRSRTRRTGPVTDVIRPATTGRIAGGGGARQGCRTAGARPDGLPTGPDPSRAAVGSSRGRYASRATAAAAATARQTPAAASRRTRGRHSPTRAGSAAGASAAPAVSSRS